MASKKSARNEASFPAAVRNKPRTGSIAAAVGALLQRAFKPKPGGPGKAELIDLAAAIDKETKALKQRIKDLELLGSEVRVLLEEVARKSKK